MAQQEVVRLKSYKKTAPQSRAEIVRLGKMLPESEGVPGLIIELTKTVEASGVHFTSITQRHHDSRHTVWHPDPHPVVVSGRYFDVEDFLYRLEEYVAFRNASFRVTGRLLQVTQLHVQGGTSGTYDDERFAAASRHHGTQRLPLGWRRELPALEVRNDSPACSPMS